MRAVATVATLFLAGCATFSPDGGFDRVEKAVAERGAGQARWVRSAEEADSVGARVKELLAQPLSAESAVQIALPSGDILGRAVDGVGQPAVEHTDGQGGARP
jgi:hypothetical protein